MFKRLVLSNKCFLRTFENSQPNSKKSSNFSKCNNTPGRCAFPHNEILIKRSYKIKNDKLK